MKTFYSIIAFLFSSFFIEAQPEWIVYDTTNSGLVSTYITSVKIGLDGKKWIGNYNRVIEFDDSLWTEHQLCQNERNNVRVIDNDGNVWATSWDFPNSNCVQMYDGISWQILNTPIDEVAISSITVDNSDNLWFTTVNEGLWKYDGNNWFAYNTSNSGLPSNACEDLAIDVFGNKWIAAGGVGLVKFDDVNWTVYDTSDYYCDVVELITISDNNVIWLGGYFCGLTKFDGTNWTKYDTFNSGLPDDYVRAIAIEDNGDKWIGSIDGGGVAKFDGTNWTVYNTVNSDLPSDYINSIAIDTYGNKWIGTYNGLAVFREGGVIAIDEENTRENNISVYPNPTTGHFTIQGATGEIQIFDLFGRLVLRTNEPQIDMSSFPAGLYVWQVGTARGKLMKE